MPVSMCALRGRGPALFGEKIPSKRLIVALSLPIVRGPFSWRVPSPLAGHNMERLLPCWLICGMAATPRPQAGFESCPSFPVAIGVGAMVLFHTAPSPSPLLLFELQVSGSTQPHTEGTDSGTVFCKTPDKCYYVSCSSSTYIYEAWLLGS